MGSILAVDYGMKRIGLAISDPDRVFAFPCEVIENKNFDYILSQINNFILEREVDLILIGMPYSMNKKKSDEKKNEMEVNVEKFINKLQKTLTIEIKIVDERLSSFAAEEKLKEAGVSAKKSKKYIDSEAARLLLEEFIQSL